MGKLPGSWARDLSWVFAAVILSGETAAQDMSTTNRDCLARFWAAAENGHKPVTVVSFGDSMADSYQSITWALINSLVGRLGVAGYSLNNYGNATMNHLTNGAQVVVGPTQFWFTDHYQLPAGGGLWWETQNSPGGVYSDAVGVFWVSQPQGGWFTLSVSTAGQVWIPIVGLSGYGSTPQGQFARIFLSPDFHRIRVDGVSGINYIIGPQLLSQKTSGVHVVFMDKGGLSLGSVTNIPISIRQPILAALEPDLIVWHMKEDGSVATSNRMLECENWWSSAAPLCDVAYIGTPYTAYDTNTTTTMDQNRLVRNIAVTKHRTYEDLMQPSVSYNWLSTQGYMVDAVHLNAAGGTYLANIMWNDLGFFALNVPRALTVKFSGQKLTAEYPTVTGIVYTLEMTTNWVSWPPIVSAPGSGQKVSTNVPGTSRSAFFRLRLSAN